MAIAVFTRQRRAGIQIRAAARRHRNGWRDGSDVEPAPDQRRFCDPDVETFLERVNPGRRAWATRQDGVSVGIAARIRVQAVPAPWPDAHRGVRAGARSGAPCAGEQPLELEQCQARHGCSPIELLEAHGFLGPRTTLVHAIHVSDGDIARLTSSRSIGAPDDRSQPR